MGIPSVQVLWGPSRRSEKDGISSWQRRPNAALAALRTSCGAARSEVTSHSHAGAWHRGTPRAVFDAVWRPEWSLALRRALAVEEVVLFVKIVVCEGSVNLHHSCRAAVAFRAGGGAAVTCVEEAAVMQRGAKQ